MNQSDARPVDPFFLCDQYCNWILLEKELKKESTVIGFGDGKKYELIAYDRDGTKWRMRYETPRSTVWERFVQYVGIPVSKVVPLRWQECGGYHIDELRGAFLSAVAHDDDVLTQFVEGDELINRLMAAATFEDLTRIWQWLSTDG